MNKLVMMAAAVAFAAVAHGASIDWGGLIFDGDMSSPTTLAANTQAFLVYSDVAFTGTGATFDGTSLTSGGTTIASKVDSLSISGDQVASYSFVDTYNKSDSDVNGYYAVLIGNSATDPTAYSFYDLGQVTGTTATSPVTMLTNYSSSLTGGGYTISSAGGSSGGDIPEPTSGLLLVVGGALLALRRKQK